jgi:hypothetical protein
MAISSSGAVTSTGTIGGSNSATLATTGSNTFTGQQYVSNTNAPVNFTDTASLYTDGGLRVGKDAYVSGTLYLNNLTVFGTQSVNFITSSQLDISDNVITVNTSTPAIRFGGIAVRDSGSLGTGLTGSLLWDSQNNHWVYTNPSGSSYSGGMMISGPRASSLGEEQGTTFNALMKGQGGDHITSSGIFESGSNVGIGVISPASKLEINGFGTANSIMTQPIIAAYATNGFNLGSDGTNALIGVSNSGTDMVFLKRAGGEYSQAMTIASTGQVFIGATSALFNAQVNINYNQSNYEGLAISTDKAYNLQPQPNLIFGGKYNSSGNYRQYATIQAYKDNATDGNSAASLVFYTNGNSASVTERMRITSNGNIGIGCTPGTITSVDIQNTSAVSSNVFLRLQNAAASEDCGIIISGSLGATPYEHRIGVNTIAATTDFCFSNSNSAGYRWYVDGTQRMTVTSSGVKFQNGSTSLNYYEEGTFSPTNINQNFDAVTVIYGRYVRIGNQVTINCRWNVTANTTGLKYLVFDLPFAFFNNANISFTGIVSNYANGNSASSSNVGTSVRNSGGSLTQQYIEAYYTTTGTAVTLLFSMTYQTF